MSQNRANVVEVLAEGSKTEAKGVGDTGTADVVEPDAPTTQISAEVNRLTVTVMLM